MAFQARAILIDRYLVARLAVDGLDIADPTVHMQLLGSGINVDKKLLRADEFDTDSKICYREMTANFDESKPGIWNFRPVEHLLKAEFVKSKSVKSQYPKHLITGAVIWDYDHDDVDAVYEMIKVKRAASSQ